MTTERKPALGNLTANTLAAAIWTASSRHDEKPWVDASEDEQAEARQWAEEILIATRVTPNRTSLLTSSEGGTPMELMRRLGPTCDACGKTLDKVFDGTPPEVLQYDNALHIRLDGGYGEFIDNIEPLNSGGDRYYSIICHECAHDLCERVPWIATMIDPARSHTHREGHGHGT